MPKSAAEDAAAGKKGDGDDASFFEPDEEELEEERESCLPTWWLVQFYTHRNSATCVFSRVRTKRLPS